MIGYADQKPLDHRSWLRRRRGVALAAEPAGPPDLELDPGPRFPDRSSGRRSQADRRHRKRAAAGRRRSCSSLSTTGRRSPSRQSWSGPPCRGMRLRERRLPPAGDQQHRHRGEDRPPPAGDGQRGRLDDRHRDEGLPELKQVYGLFGQSDLVSAVTYKQFPHNYNEKSRERMYAWFEAASPAPRKPHR